MPTASGPFWVHQAFVGARPLMKFILSSELSTLHANRSNFHATSSTQNCSRPPATVTLIKQHTARTVLFADPPAVHAIAFEARLSC